MSRIVKKPEERRQEIIATARELFQTQEYQNTSMNHIMKKLNIAKGTIYHYFKSKDDLLKAVVENIIEEDIARKEALLQNVSANALEKLRLLIMSNNSTEENDKILEHLHQPGNVAMHTQLLAVAIQKQARLYADVFQEGCDEGVFEVENPLECAEFLLTGIQFLTDLGVYPWTEDDLMRRIMAFPSLIEAQLNAPKGSFDFLVTQLSNPE